MSVCGLDSSCSEEDPLAGFCGHVMNLKVLVRRGGG
jgi:hypothetical protein